MKITPSEEPDQAPRRPNERELRDLQPVLRLAAVDPDVRYGASDAWWAGFSAGTAWAHAHPGTPLPLNPFSAAGMSAALDLGLIHPGEF